MLDLEKLKRGVREDMKAIMQDRPFPFIDDGTWTPNRPAPVLDTARPMQNEVKSLLASGFSMAEVHRRTGVSIKHITMWRDEMRKNHLKASNSI